VRGHFRLQATRSGPSPRRFARIWLWLNFDGMENDMALKISSSCWMGRFILVAFVILCQSSILAGTQNPGPERYRVFLLKFISAQEATQLLTDANIAKASQLNDANMLLVHAEPEALVKAANVLKLADSPEKYAVKVLLPASKSNLMPPLDTIEAEIGNISIGTFFNPPGGASHKAIIGTHNDVLIAVAPVSVMDKIAAFAESATKATTPSPAADTRGTSDEQRETKDQPSVTEPNAMFNELLSTLAEAERKSAQTPAILTEPLPDFAPSDELAEPQKELNLVTTAEAAEEAESPSAEELTTEPNLAQPGQIEPDEAQNDIAPLLYEPQTIPNADEVLDLVMPDKLDILQLLDLVGKYLNLNYVYKPQELAGKEVNLKFQGKITVGELYALVESVLKFTGLAMTRKGNLVTIVPLGDALEIDPALIDAERSGIEAGDIVVTRIFQLDYVNTSQAKAILDGMRVGAVSELPTMGTLIVTGYAYRMNRVEQLLDVIDKPGRPKQFKFRQLRYTMAKTLAPKVKQLVEQLGDISIAVAKAEAQPQPVTRRGRQIRRTPTPAPTPESAKPSIYLDADERTNRILMIGNEQEIAIVEDLIDALDVAQQDLRTLRMYEIQHVDAEDVRKKLEALGVIGASRETPGRITARAAAPGQRGAPQASPTPTAGGEAMLPAEELQVVVIESTNSLLVNASPEQHALIATIIGYVDSESIQQAIPYVVYPLQNQPPEHLAEVLEKLVLEYTQTQEGKIEKIRKTEEEIIIVPDPSTFSLIVYASKKNQDWLANLIKTLDKRRPQVLIDVTLVEVTNTEAFDLDLALATKLPTMQPGGTMDYLGALLGGRGIDKSATPSTSFIGSSQEGYSNPAAGIAQGFYSDRHIQMLLTAMESKSYGRVLAKPKILVNDGQRGSIRTTDTTNVEISTTIVPQEGQPQISTSYQPYNAGITLEIQPNIGEGNLLLLIVRLDRTDFLPREDTSVPPDTRANTVDTIVTVPNNKTIILGGLLKLNQSKGGSKVPLLGDIPLVGGLFRSSGNTVNDSKLYVFVKANILRPEATLAGLPELESISDRNREAFEQYEDTFQKYENWPGLKSKPVDPLRVLEAE
jgi:general secretion pathway protein D